MIFFRARRAAHREKISARAMCDARPMPMPA